MSIILKPLFEILTGEVAVCENILLNYAIMLGIGETSHVFAFKTLKYTVFYLYINNYLVIYFAFSIFLHSFRPDMPQNS